MKYTITPKGLSNPSLTVGQVVHHLARIVAGKIDRNAFFQILSKQIRELFHYDRFCINLYDAEREFLNLFTAADGTVVESLSNTRIARNTVAGLAISSRKPVVINDLSVHNLGDGPMASAQELQQKMGINAEAAASLEKTPANSPVDRALEAGDAYVVARVLKAVPASTAPLETVKDKITARLQGEKALAEAMRALRQRNSKPALRHLSRPVLIPCCVKQLPAMWAALCNAWAKNCRFRLKTVMNALRKWVRTDW